MSYIIYIPTIVTAVIMLFIGGYILSVILSFIALICRSVYGAVKDIKNKTKWENLRFYFECSIGCLKNQVFIFPLKDDDYQFTFKEIRVIACIFAVIVACLFIETYKTDNLSGKLDDYKVKADDVIYQIEEVTDGNYDSLDDAVNDLVAKYEEINYTVSNRYPDDMLLDDIMSETGKDFDTLQSGVKYLLNYYCEHP